MQEKREKQDKQKSEAAEGKEKGKQPPRLFPLFSIFEDICYLIWAMVSASKPEEWMFLTVRRT